MQPGNDGLAAEPLSGPSGTPTATYGYTAYGSPVTAMSTGADKNNTSPGPNVVPYNSYRFNAMQWDPASGQYNMGFRNYDPGMGSFTTRDMYNGSSADMTLTSDPFSGGAYAFGDANPISNIELDGHCGILDCVRNWLNQQASNLLGGAANGITDTANFLGTPFRWLGAQFANSFPTGVTPGGQLTFTNHASSTVAKSPWHVGDRNSILYKVGYYGWGLLFPPAAPEDEAGALAGEEGSNLGRILSNLLGRTICGVGESFTPRTQVLLADGKTAAIASLKPGAKVIATNTTTGKTQPETVTAVLVRHDTDLYDLTVKTAHGSAVIHTTSNHLFWDPYLHQWRAANKLSKNEHLKAPDGATVTVIGGITPKVHDGWMWDLTVPGNNDHDFYVIPSGGYDVTGDVPVLVHNSPPGACSLTSAPDAPVINSKTVFTAKDGSFRIDLENQNPGEPGAGATGIRLAELAGIRYDPGHPGRSDLDLDRREIYVRGKGGKDRTVRIDHEAARRVDRYLRARFRHAQAYRPQLWLGVNNRGPLTANGIYQMVDRRGKQAGVEVWPHRFRHHFSHTWLDHGGAEGDLMELNGWSSPQMLRRYGGSARGVRARRHYDLIMNG